MELLRQALHVTALAILVVGPPCVLWLWFRKARRLPTLPGFTLGCSLACALGFWALFFLAEHVLELQFHELVPDGSWTDADEQAWSDPERRVAEAYFADGARNVFALYAPVLLFPYSGVVWAIARAGRALARRRAVS